MKSWDNIKKSEWRGFAEKWRALNPPYKPSRERIDIYHYLIKKYVKGNKALVLGATPEIRDLLAKLKFKVTLLDISLPMVRAMTFLKKTRNKEKIVIGNWLKARFNEKYDLVIGDSVINNLLPGQYTKFFKQVQRFLKNDGIFISQGVFLSKPISKHRISIKQIINKAKNRPDYYRIYSNKAYDYLTWSVSQTKKHLANFGTLNEIWRQKLENGQISKKEFKLLDFDLPEDLTISFFTKKEFERTLCKFWQILDQTHEKSHRVHKDFYRIYVLKKK